MSRHGSLLPALLLVALACGTALAQEAPKEPAAAKPQGPSLAEKRTAKLAEAWVAAGGWTLDYEKALAQAKETGKPLVAYFTRSYAF